MTNEKLRISPTVEEEIPEVLEALRQAKEHMARLGNKQWRDGYPSEEALLEDMAKGAAMTLKMGDKIAGYMALLTRDEGYDACTLWDQATPYIALHRLGFGDDFRGGGRSYQAFEAGEKWAADHGIGEVRVDTGVDNAPMRHILEKAGYECLGRWIFPWGERLAYSKRIENRE